MQDWVAFFLSTWEMSINWLEQMTIFGVSLIEFIIATFVLGVILRALLYKA